MVSQKMQERTTERTVQWQVVCLMLFCSYESVSSLLHYSIPEETKKDFVVGNLAKDLGLNLRALTERKFRISSVTAEHLFSVNLENGNLLVANRIDRETICEMTTNCILNLEAVIENPIQVYHVEVEIRDINDNPPVFSKNAFNLEISEYTHPRTRFVLGNALDPDIGINSLQTYKISENNYFKLGQKTSADGRKYPELILENPLDRETESSLEIILTALDGGNPTKTGTAVIKIIVSDINDNTPVFEKDLYQVSMVENVPIDTLVLRLIAKDEDEGLNGQVTYSFSHITKVGQQIFTINPQTGEIRTKGELDFETTRGYEMIVEAEDGGGLVSHCKVVVQIVDANDNVPEIILTSVSNSLPEDSLPGTVIALINIRDLDSGGNGDVSCQLEGSLPFELMSSSSNYYRLITAGTLDREDVDCYNITIKATDKGSPPLSTMKTLRLHVSDVNDNPPMFEQTQHSVFVPENKASGSSIYRVTSSDPDSHDNAKVTYSIVTKNIGDSLVSSYVSMNSMTGVLYAQRQFDYEQLREFDIQIIAKDNGSPSMQSNTTVKIYITDQNDNAPKILYPSLGADGSPSFEIAPHSSNKGYLVTKVVAVDADSGHNAWLSYHFLKAPENFHFSIGKHSGEIRTSRVFQDREILKQKIIILVKDHGNPPLSSTVVLNLVVAENLQQEVSEINTQSQNSDSQSNLNVYLVIGLAVISFLFTVTVMLAIILRCRKSNHPKTFGPLSSDIYSQVGPIFPPSYNGTLTLPYKYDVCVALDSTENEFTYHKPAQIVPTENLIGTNDSGIGISSLNDTLPTDLKTQQAQPNTDWRFSQAQRPGPSGAQPTEESGVWPNNQLETERLQAMILASANAAEGTSALGGGNGTMGLSARYGPQFTLQHVPDYRQNIYIPGTTTTLTNAAGKREGKAAAPSGGNKKKSGKKEKK